MDQEIKEENEVKLDQHIQEIQKKYSIASNVSNLYNYDELKLKEWAEQSRHILLTQLVPTYLNDISQQMIYGFENEVAMKTNFLKQEITKLQLQYGEKNREVARLTLDLNFMTRKSNEREKLYEQKLCEILKHVEKREQQFTQISSEKTKYWIERINELTTLFLEVKNFILSVRNHIPREVYMGELFRFKRLFSIEELMEKSIYSENHKAVWELYHDLETKTRSNQIEIDNLQQLIDQLSSQKELKDKTIQRLNMEILEYLQKIDHLEEDNRFYIQEIEEVKQETEMISLQIEKQCQEIIISKNTQMEAFHLKYISSISQQDQIIQDQAKQIHNLDTFLSSINKENLNFQRENQDLKQEVQYLNEQKSRQARIYDDSLHYNKVQKDSIIQSLQKQIESDKTAYDANKKAIEDIYEQKTMKWQTLYKNLIIKLRQSDSDTLEKESQLSYAQIQDQNSLEMLKQITTLEEKIEELTEQNNFLAEENNLLQTKIEDIQIQKNQLQQTLEGIQENFDKWMKESEESQIKIKALTHKVDQQRQKIDEQDKQLGDLLDKKKKTDKEQFQLKMQYDFDIKAIKQQNQKEVDKMKRELEDKMEQQIKLIKNEFKNNNESQTKQNSKQSLEQQIEAAKVQQQQSQQQFLPEEIQQIVSKAIQAKEAKLLEEQRFNEASIKKFYDAAIKQLCEDFEKEQKLNEQKQKEFYENLLQDSKKHHSKLQESLISNNIESYDQVVQEALQKSSQFESQCLFERQQNLELSLELKKQTLEVSLFQKKAKELEDEITQLKYQLEEQNLESLKQKRINDQKMIETDYQYRVEKEKYLATLRREKDLSKQMQLMEIQYEEQLKSQHNLSNNEQSEIKSIIKSQYEEQVNKLCLEQSIQIQRFQQEFHNFKELSNRRYNTLKLKYEDLLLIHQTQKQIPISEPQQYRSPSPKKRQQDFEQVLQGNSEIYNGLKEKNITSRAYTSLSQHRDENKSKEFSKFSYSTDFNQISNQDQKILVSSKSEISKQGRVIINSFTHQANQSGQQQAKQKIQSNMISSKDDVSFDGTLYLKKYPFTKVSSHVKNYTSIDPKREMNLTFSISNTNERSNNINKLKQLTPNRINQSLDLDRLDEQQKKIDENKKVYRMRKFNIFENFNKCNNDQDSHQREYISPQLDNINISLNPTQSLIQQNKTMNGQTFSEQINIKHNQLYSTLKHFKNNTIRIERKQIKLSNLPMGNNN